MKFRLLSLYLSLPAKPWLGLWDTGKPDHLPLSSGSLQWETVSTFNSSGVKRKRWCALHSRVMTRMGRETVLICFRMGSVACQSVSAPAADGGGQLWEDRKVRLSSSVLIPDEGQGRQLPLSTVIALTKHTYSAQWVGKTAWFRLYKSSPGVTHSDAYSQTLLYRSSRRHLPLQFFPGYFPAFKLDGWL